MPVFLIHFNLIQFTPSYREPILDSPWLVESLLTSHSSGMILFPMFLGCLCGKVFMDMTVLIVAVDYVHCQKYFRPQFEERVKTLDVVLMFHRCDINWLFKINRFSRTWRDMYIILKIHLYQNLKNELGLLNSSDFVQQRSDLFKTYWK